MKLSIITLCDSFGRLKDDGYDQPIDLVLCLGDLDNPWLEQRVEKIQPTYGAFGIRGNHDGAFDFPAGITGLEFGVGIIPILNRNIRIAGVPGSWKYKESGHWLYTQREMQRRLEGLPACDILISHNCPANIGHERPGESEREFSEGVHQGFTGLNTYIEENKPAFCFHGHQHLRKTSLLGDTTVVGCFGEDYHEINVAQKA